MAAGILFDHSCVIQCLDAVGVQLGARALFQKDVAVFQLLQIAAQGGQQNALVVIGVGALALIVVLNGG